VGDDLPGDWGYCEKGERETAKIVTGGEIPHGSGGTAQPKTKRQTELDEKEKKDFPKTGVTEPWAGAQYGLKGAKGGKIARNAEGGKGVSQLSAARAFCLGFTYPDWQEEGGKNTGGADKLKQKPKKNRPRR